MHHFILLAILALIAVALTGGCAPGTDAESALTSSHGGLTVEAVRGGSLDAVRLTDESGHVLETIVEEGGEIRQVLLAELGGKTHVAVLLAPSDAGDCLSLYTVDDGELSEIWRGIPSSLRPWKVDIADVDGDGSNDIAVGVHKTARFHPVMANRLFVYGWDGEDIYPKWLGSRLSRPFTDFAFVDTESGVRLVAIEETADGCMELAVYEWSGFGFTREWTGASAKSLTDLRTDGETVSVRSGRTTQRFALEGNSLRAEK